MKYVIDINQKHAESIQDLINKGDYNSISQFVNVAIENQIHLETSDAKPISNNIESESIPETKQNNTIESKWETYRINNITSHPQTVPYPDPSGIVLTSADNEPKQMWIWGQINKILPVKIGLRVLYKELENDKYIEMDNFLNKALQFAVKINYAIQNYEIKLSKTRSEKISAGLPDMEKKSQTRYKSQFLVYSRKDSLLDGAMSLLKFINVDIESRKGKILLGLTQSGVEFAEISNPSLDNSSFEQSLSQEEIDYYLKHIKTNVPNEHNAIKWLLNKINEGFNEREAIKKEMKNEFQELWNASDAVINTQRAGLTSRITELRLLDKEKNGIYVIYHVSDSGKSFLENN
ncbi:MAG TPA: hypothetical protein VJY62_18465 [Bacteroidia bacterium]|nr:hypothetical protein [Bacteroidia bacterium]